MDKDIEEVLHGSKQKQKEHGAFYTPDYASVKSLEYVREIIKNLPEDTDYIIVDRCAGTGNLEKFMTDEELSHCILNTLEQSEYDILVETFGDKCKKIMKGNALTEEFNKELKEFIDNERNKIENGEA